MDEEQLNKPFQEVRAMPPETSPSDIYSRVSSAAQSVGSGLSTKSFFTFKGIAMITTIASVIGIAVFSHFAPATKNDNSGVYSVSPEFEIATNTKAAPPNLLINDRTVRTTVNSTGARTKLNQKVEQFEMLPQSKLSRVAFVKTTVSGELLSSDIQCQEPDSIPLAKGTSLTGVSLEKVSPDAKVWDNFTRLKISPDMKVWIIQGDKCDVRVESVHPQKKAVVLVEQKGELLEISIGSKQGKRKVVVQRDTLPGQPIEIIPDQPSASSPLWGEQNQADINVYVTIRELKELEVSGAVEVVSKNKLTCSRLKIDLSGAVETQLELSAGTVSVETSGAVELDLKGDCNHLDIETSGAAEVRAQDLKAESCSVETSGASSVDVRALKALRISSSGASNVTYRGEPEKLEVETSGASEVRKIVQGYKF